MTHLEVLRHVNNVDFERDTSEGLKICCLLLFPAFLCIHDITEQTKKDKLVYWRWETSQLSIFINLKILHIHKF